MKAEEEQRTHPVTSRRHFLLWAWILIACGLLRAVFFILHINAPLSIDSPYPVDVGSGTTFNRLVSRLADEGVLDNPFDVRLYARLSGRADDIKAGEYSLTPGMTPSDLLDKLVAGDVIIHQVILPEGWTLRQALAAIQNHAMVVASLAPGDPVQIQAALGTGVYPEGMVFPDTYNFSRGTTDLELLRRAYALMQNVLANEWAGRDVGLPYDTPYEALIMASIIEKETGLASEREQIAGVFIRRLQRGMRLQTDPTVIYGLGDNFNGDLTRADLRRQTPYNTYLNSGLPPTPIALPGRDSIYASLHPDQSDTLYFVARGDGSHYFSSSLEEHERAVQQYQSGNQ
jgi:UPF0755 protein